MRNLYPKRAWLFLLLLLPTLAVFSQNLELGSSPQLIGGNSSTMVMPVKWSFKKEQQKGTLYKLTFEAEIDSGWYIYSLHIDAQGAEFAPSPTAFTFEKNSAITFVDALHETATEEHEEHDPMFENLLIKTLGGKAVFTQTITMTDSNAMIRGLISYQACSDVCVPLEEEFVFGDASQMSETPIITTTSSFGSQSLLGIFIAGFLGGLLALLTPCVFPMIPMTVSFFTRSSKTKSKGVMNALIYGFSIIVIYVLLGFVVTKLLGADALGQMASSAFFNLVFFAIFVVFAFSFFGYFEITLPAGLVNRMDKASDKGGLIGIFFMAFTLSLVSFSCTGPIIGTLLVEAAMKGSNLGPLAGMFGFSLALALPFGLFAAFPGWLSSLPKSGGWLNGVKVVLGFAELALALKFLSNVDLVYHWDFLKREIFLSIWIIISLLTALYILGIIRFPHDGKVKRLSPARIAFAAPFIAFIFYLGSGLNGSSLKLLSGITPPINYSLWNETECPHGIECFKDLDEGIAYAKLVRKPILVDFTGNSCANCRKMEENVWVEPDVLKYLKEDYVLISLYVDDSTPLPESEQIPSCTKKKPKTKGNKWGAYQNCKFSANILPYYVLIDANQDTLNTPIGFTLDKDAYIDFLQEGLDKFKNEGGKLSLSSLE